MGSRSRRAWSLVALLALTGAACSGDGDEAGKASDAFVERQQEYLTHVTTTLEPGSALDLLAHGELGLDLGVTVADLQPVLDRIDAFEDTTDFDVLYLLNLWYRQRDALPDDVRAAIERRFLSFKYWYTEPTPEGVVDDKYYWSENHRAIFHVDEYLAGQAFPDETFTNDGRTGAEHRDEARGRLLEWMDEKARFGWTEWHSDVYYQKDATPLLSLVELADDDELRARAAVLLDVLLLDIALHLHRGNFGATHGRSYIKDKSRAIDQDVFGLAKLLFDDTTEPYRDGADPGAVLFAVADRYRVPEVIRRIARSGRTFVDRERMGVPIDPAAPVEPDPEAPYGYDFDDPDNVPFWWERGAQTAWQVVPLTLETLDRHDLWESKFFAPFQGLADIVGDDRDAARALAQSLAPMLGFGLLPEVVTYTYRSPHVMLSTALDHRPGHFSEQAHVWQATLDERAVVFTTHPKEEPETGTEWPDGDGYWNGTGSLPRAAQHETAAIVRYRPAFTPPGDGPLAAFTYIDATHAYFPQEHFDEVVRDRHWTFGRKGDGYVALWSQAEPDWRPAGPGEFTNGLTQPYDLRAPGAENTWVVEVGDVDRYGSFDAFRAAARGGTPRLEGEVLVYDSPGSGELRLGFDGPLGVAGELVELQGGPRFDNPWLRLPWGETLIRIDEAGHGLTIDLATGRREVRRP